MEIESIIAITVVNDIVSRKQAAVGATVWWEPQLSDVLRVLHSIMTFKKQNPLWRMRKTTFKKKEGEKYKSVKYCMLISVGQLIRCYSNCITFSLTGREKVQFEIHQLQYSYKSLHYFNILGVDSFVTWMVHVSLSLCLWCSFSHSIHSTHIDNHQFPLKIIIWWFLKNPECRFKRLTIVLKVFLESPKSLLITCHQIFHLFS